MSLALGLLSGVALVSCVSPVNDEKGLPPFFETLPTEDRSSSGFAVRPLFFWERSEEGSEVAALWPIFGFSEREDGSYRRRAIPLLYSRKLVDEEGREDKDTFLALVIAWGSDPEEGSYFAFIPLFGTLKGLYFQGTMRLVLFPLFLQLSNENRTVTYFLFPFFRHTSGPTRQGWHFWPFYGRTTAITREGDPKYDRRFYLWPFFHRHDYNLDSDRPLRARWFWPFYGSIRGPSQRQISIFWPLLTVERKRDPESRTFRFLIWRITRGEGTQNTDFWPLYGHRRSEFGVRRFVLWPIHSYQRFEAEGVEHVSNRVVPFYWHNSRKDLATGAEQKVTRYWPFYTRREHADGRKEHYVLDLLPLNDPVRFDRLYSRIWRIYRRVDRGPGQGRAWDVLWGLASGEKTPRQRRFTLLGGLIEREVEGADSRWRILYIPF